VAALRSAYGLDDAQPSIVHTTLFRFGEGLRNPAGLLESAERIRIGARLEVQEVVLTREVLYPSLITEDLAVFPLASPR
jgi:hypothetical protein